MSKVIRVSDEIFEMIQQDAEPLVDNADSVLRRWAETLGKIYRSRKDTNERTNVMRQPVRNRQFRGDTLNRKYGVGARQSRYHKDGTFFECITKFPGALFDPDGFVVFSSRKEYEGCPQLHIGAKLNVPTGISTIRGYKRYPTSP